MAGCLCEALDTVVKVGDHQSFFKDLGEIEVGDWARLMQCRACGALWCVAEWDKYQTQLATKIAPAKRSSWQVANTKAQKEFLVKNRGGLSAQPCMWAHCDKPRVVGVALCVDHLYETGARE